VLTRVLEKAPNMLMRVNDGARMSHVVAEDAGGVGAVVGWLGDANDVRAACSLAGRGFAVVALMVTADQAAAWARVQQWEADDGVDGLVERVQQLLEGIIVARPPQDW
jgi:hypothetical protein